MRCQAAEAALGGAVREALPKQIDELNQKIK